jgi:hypothetical protein
MKVVWAMHHICMMPHNNTLTTTLSGRKHQACQLFISGFFLLMMSLSFRRAQYFEAGLDN